MSRADRVADRAAARGLDALLVSDAADVRYVSGFSGSSGYAVVGAGIRRFVTDFRYVEQARAEVPDFDREQGPQQLLDALRSGWPSEVGRLGFDDATLSVRAHARLRAAVPGAIELVPAAGVVGEERAVKEPGEVEKLRAAAALGDSILEWLTSGPIVGRSEREIAVVLEHEMRLRGATGPSFPSIVASGPHGALPHASPRDVPIAAGTLVTFDLGVVLDGYCSDVTRTWATGPLQDELADIYALCLRAQLAALAAVRPGPLGRDVDALARGLIADGGHGDHFGHGLGHGVGLEVHEAPRLARSGETPLVAGNAVTVEPGIYLPGVGGVRIEDLVVVTADGCDVLTHTTKELVTVS